MYLDSYEVGCVLRHQELLELMGREEEIKVEEGKEQGETVYDVDHDFMTFKPKRNEEFENEYQLAF